MKTLLVTLVVATAATFGETPPIIKWIGVYTGSPGATGSPSDFAVGNDGSVYVVGTSEKARSPSELFAHGGRYNESAMVKFDVNGSQVWAVRYSMFEDTADAACGIAIDEEGNAYITGNSIRPMGGVVCVTMKYDANGREVWKSTHDHGSASALVIDNQRCTYVSGTGSGCYQTIKYDPCGRALWARHFSRAFNRRPWFQDMAIDAHDNVYIAGNGGVVKYSPKGEEVWVGECEAEKIAVEDDGSFTVIGAVHPFGKPRYYCTSRYASDGKEVWTQRFTMTGGQALELKAIGLDAHGNVFVGGLYSRSDKTTGTVLTKYSSAGHQDWQQSCEKSSASDSYILVDICVNKTGDTYVLVSGRRQGSGVVSTDLFLMKYNTLGKLVWQERQSWKFGTLERMRVSDKEDIYVMGHGGEYGEFVIAKFGPEKTDLVEESENRETQVTANEVAYRERMRKYLSSLFERFKHQAEQQMSNRNFAVPNEAFESDIYRKWGLGEKRDFSFFEKYYIMQLPMLAQTWHLYETIDLRNLTTEEQRFLDDMHTKYGKGKINYRRHVATEDGLLDQHQQDWFNLIEAVVGSDELDDKGLVFLHRMTPK